MNVPFYCHSLHCVRFIRLDACLHLVVLLDIVFLDKVRLFLREELT